MNNDKKYIPSFSLFESVVAIAIISVLIAIATMIYGNVVSSEKPLLYYQAEVEVSKKLEAIRREQEFISRVYEYDDYSILQQVEFYRGNKKIYEVSFTVQAHENHWFTQKHLIVNPHVQ